jgi:type I restriction enzyme S subunit
LRATRPEILSLASGSTHKTIYMPDLHALTIPLPSVDQQRLAVKEIQSATARSRQLRRHLKSLKALSKEYLRSLITEAVTGQIDVVAVSESQMDERALATLQSATTSEGSVA